MNRENWPIYFCVYLTLAVASLLFGMAYMKKYDAQTKAFADIENNYNEYNVPRQLVRLYQQDSDLYDHAKSLTESAYGTMPFFAFATLSCGFGIAAILTWRRFG